MKARTICDIISKQSEICTFKFINKSPFGTRLFRGKEELNLPILYLCSTKKQLTTVKLFLLLRPLP